MEPPPIELVQVDTKSGTLHISRPEANPTREAWVMLGMAARDELTAAHTTPLNVTAL
jgi:hypothetical protein